MHILKKLKSLELDKEKIKDFKNVVIVQLVLITIAMLFRDTSDLIGIRHIEKLHETIFFLVLGIYVWTLWDMLRNYTQSKLLVMALLILILGTFILAIIFINPYYSFLESIVFKYFSAGIMFTLLIVEITVMYYTIVELITKDIRISERLWGAVCVYLITGIAFGSIYEIIAIINSDAIGFNVQLGTSHFMNSIGFSFMMLGGMDIYYECISLIKSIATLETITGNLFIVFVVGRMLYK